MVSVDLLLLDFTAIGHLLKAKEVLGVEVALVEGLHFAVVLVEFLEEFGLFGVDHRIFGEHDDHHVVESGEPGLGGGLLLIGASFVVEGGEEYRFLNVLIQAGGVTPVPERSDMVLKEAHVCDGADDLVDNVADHAAEAVRNVDDAHVRSTDAEQVAHLTRHLAVGGDVTGNQSSLRKAHDVELSLEMGVSVEFLAAFGSLV